MGLTVMLFVGNVVHSFIASFIIAALEACLPLAVGIILSTVAVQDASLELVLTMPTAYRWIASLPFALILSWTLLATLALFIFLPWIPVKTNGPSRCFPVHSYGKRPMTALPDGQM
ncbi:MAG TPA: hypothetical protein VED37_12375 [Ktedonobacteraceae bacterium]|nr:hypothetical protein [Ktedonobacteraceae bacterium]